MSDLPRKLREVYNRPVVIPGKEKPIASQLLAYGPEPLFLKAADEIERLQAELAWCHEGLTLAHEVINPGVPAPDWSIVFAALDDQKPLGGLLP